MSHPSFPAAAPCFPRLANPAPPPTFPIHSAKPPPSPDPKIPSGFSASISDPLTWCPLTRALLQPRVTGVKPRPPEPAAPSLPLCLQGDKPAAAMDAWSMGSRYLGPDLDRVPSPPPPLTAGAPATVVRRLHRISSSSFDPRLPFPDLNSGVSPCSVPTVPAGFRRPRPPEPLLETTYITRRAPVFLCVEDDADASSARVDRIGQIQLGPRCYQPASSRFQASASPLLPETRLASPPHGPAPPPRPASASSRA